MSKVLAGLFLLSALGSYELFYAVWREQSYGLPVKIVLVSSPFVLVVTGVGLLISALI